MRKKTTNAIFMGMEGLIGIVGIALMVMEGVELFEHSSTRTIVAACACCFVYMFYRWCKKIDLSAEQKKEEPAREEPEKKEPVRSEYAADYHEEIYEPKKPRRTETASNKTGYLYEPPDKKAISVSKVIQKSNSAYAFTRLDQIRIADGSWKKAIVIHICFKNDAVDITVHGTKHPYLNLRQIQENLKFMSAYIRGGSPSLDEPFIFAGISFDKTGGYDFPDDKRCIIEAGNNLKSAIYRLIVELIAFYGEPPSYYFQIV